MQSAHIGVDRFPLLSLVWEQIKWFEMGLGIHRSLVDSLKKVPVIRSFGVFFITLKWLMDKQHYNVMVACYVSNDI